MSQPPAARLDITLDVCPMTFVKTKLELEDLAPGDVLEVRLRDGEPLRNVLRSCEEDGHEIVSRVASEDGIWVLLVRRGANP